MPEARRSPAGQPCELYAIGNTVVYPHGRPPMPPMPWIRHDPATERTFSPREFPLIHELGKSRLETAFVSDRKPRAIALKPGGQFTFFSNSEIIYDVARRALETCGGIAGVPCMIVAADDSFVVPVPASMKAIGFFNAATNPSIVAGEREGAARKLADASSGWSAVAIGAAGRAGLAVQAASEQAATTGAGRLRQARQQLPRDRDRSVHRCAE